MNAYEYRLGSHLRQAGFRIKRIKDGLKTYEHASRNVTAAVGRGKVRLFNGKQEEVMVMDCSSITPEEAGHSIQAKLESEVLF